MQAIGGVNEKIEGFYRVCKAIGLTGSQGVLVPRANVANLMLDPETVDAVERGAFHIYPIDTIDRGIEMLTGVRAGSIDEPGTINYLVDQRLQKIANTLRDRAIARLASCTTIRRLHRRPNRPSRQSRRVEETPVPAPSPFPLESRGCRSICASTRTRSRCSTISTNLRSPRHSSSTG